MRWDNLKVENGSGESANLPGFRDPAVVRTFDAPEALGTRFYEIRARSAINEVPKRSRMPFRYTINAYRGCTHACAYCVSGDTMILMGDGRTKPIADVRVGDEICGTVRTGHYRRYATTTVLNHWETYRTAYRVLLEDGTELIASGDHRFLTTQRGWKFVVGSEQGRNRRPHLTLNNQLLGSGGFAKGPLNSSPEYRRGYVCGMVRGDGTIGHYSYPTHRRKRGEIHAFRLLLADFEGLHRTRRYLADFDVATHEDAARVRQGGVKPTGAIRTGARASVAVIEDLVGWPRYPETEWCKGFLAGIFDAEGSYGGGPGGGILRIANTDQEIIDWVTYCMRRLTIPHVVEQRRRSNGLCYVRVRGGLREHLRFFHLTDPAITRKRSIAGTALKCDADLRVASIERLPARKRLFDITTGTGDFIANGVVSHNCFARPTHTYLDFNAREDFEREIVVKVNVPELVRAELGRKSWEGEHVALGTNTDPYQWVEGRYRLMEGIWEAMRDHSNPCSVLTKSPLLLRDVGLMKEISERTEFAANLSIPTLDEKAWRATEPHTPHPRKRIEAVAELTRAGIKTGVLIAPLIPGVNDAPEQLAPLLEGVTEAGADSIGGVGLHLRGEVREIWFDWLREHRPDLLPRYEELYARGAYLPADEKNRLAGLVRTKRAGGRIRASRNTGHAPKPAEPAKRAEQTSLF